MNSFEIKALFTIATLGSSISTTGLLKYLGAEPVQSLISRGLVTVEEVNKKTWFVPTFEGNKIIDRTCSLLELI